MKKKLKRWGNNLVVVFTQEDEAVYGIAEGDIIEIDDMLIERKQIKKRRKKNEDKRIS